MAHYDIQDNYEKLIEQAASARQAELDAKKNGDHKDRFEELFQISDSDAQTKMRDILANGLSISRQDLKRYFLR